MKLVCDEAGIRIEPEDAQDRAYIRDVLGLVDDGDEARTVLVKRMGVEAVGVERIHQGGDDE